MGGDPDRARQAQAIGNAVTHLHRQHYGRGATTTRTIYHGNYALVILEDIYTPVERTLIDAGREESVRETRRLFGAAMSDRFCDAVEEITGRKVAAFLAQVHFDPDLATVVFVLEPDAAAADAS